MPKIGRISRRSSRRTMLAVVVAAVILCAVLIATCQFSCSASLFITSQQTRTSREAIVDRIEGKTAVLELEDGRHADVPLSELPEGTGQGDVLVREHGRWRVDERRREQRLAESRRLMDGLFGD